MANKTTKRDVINMMLADSAIKTNELFVAYLTHELELLDNKKANKKATKNQEENEVFMEVIVEVLGRLEKGTVTEIMKADERLSELSNQRVSALLTKLKDNKVVSRTIDGRKAVFSLV